MSLLEEAKARLRLRMLSEGSIDNVEIEEIPETWQPFDLKKPKGDKWVRVNYPDNLNTSGCLYNGKDKSIFLGHRHEESGELMTICKVGGVMEVVTDKKITFVEFPDSIFIPKDVPHAVVFHSETFVNIMWDPKFIKGWNSKSPIILDN